MVMAARFSARTGRISAADATRLETAVGRLGLPVSPPRFEVQTWLELMGRDKKAVDGLTFVLDSPRGLEVVPGVDAGQVRLALEAIR